MGVQIPKIGRVKRGAGVFGNLIAQVNLLADLLEESWLVDGAGTTVTDSPSGRGRSIDLSRNVSGGGTGLRLPLEPYETSSGGDLKISITWGTVGGLTLDTYGPVTITATRYFFAKMTCTSAGVPSTVELIDQASATPSANTDTVSYLLLGYATVASGAISAISRNLGGSQSYERCGYAGNYTHHFTLI